MWPENSWKYDEVRYYYTLAAWKNAGVDLNRIEALKPEDFLKAHYIGKML